MTEMTDRERALLEAVKNHIRRGFGAPPSGTEFQSFKNVAAAYDPKLESPLTAEEDLRRMFDDPKPEPKREPTGTVWHRATEERVRAIVREEMKSEFGRWEHRWTQEELDDAPEPDMSQHGIYRKLEAIESKLDAMRPHWNFDPITGQMTTNKGGAK